MDYEDNVFLQIHVRCPSHYKIFYRGIHPFVNPDAAGEAPALISTGKLVAREEERIGSTIPMPTFARRLPLFLWIFHRVLWLGSKDSRYRNFNLTNSPLHHHFLCWKIRFRNQVTTCSDFPSEAMLWINEVEMVDSMEELKSSRSVAGEDFPNFELLDARIASALNKIIQNSHFKKKVSLEEQKAQQEDRFLRGGQIAYMISFYLCSST